MDDIMALFTGAVGLAKGATETAKNIKILFEKPDIDTVVAKGLISDLQDRLIKLQAEQMAMQSTVLEFRDRQQQLRRFEAEADRYVLHKSELGSLVRRLKETDPARDPAHDACADCYNRQIISFLQPSGFNRLKCNTCGGEFLVPDGRSSYASARGGLRTGFNVLDPYRDD